MLRTHRIIGWLTFAFFIGTGFFLHYNMERMIAGNEAARFTLRANHIYILMAALLNIAAGAIPLAAATPRRAAIARAGRTLLFLAPFTLISAFIGEGPNPRTHLIERPLTVLGVFALVFGIWWVAVIGSGGRARPATPNRS